MPPLEPFCWSCAAPVEATAVDVESVIQARTAADGGPFLWYRCPGCGTPNGVLSAPRRGWLLYPLEGRDGSPAIDWIGSKDERRRRRQARAWWQRHGDEVETFRRTAAADPPPRKRTGPSTRRPPPPPPKPPPRRSRRPPPPPPPRRPRPDPPPPAAPVDAPRERLPHEVLGVAPDADEKAVRAAYRAAVKLCHPDRVAGLDPDFQELAHRKVKELRRAYEALLDDLRP